MHLNSRLMFERYALPYFRDGARVLEIGPDSHPSTLQRVVGGTAECWHTTDIFEHAKLNFVQTDPNVFPIAADSYDVVVSANVIEHVRQPWIWIKEAARVCRAGGHVITVAPVSWPYHEAPIDCWRIYPEGFKALLSEADLEAEVVRFESLEVSENASRIPFMTFQEYLDRRPWIKRVFWRLIVALGIPQPAAFDAIAVGRKRSRVV